ncbi:MAG: hypothetical protein IPI05_05530 [Flavobacteriales bacterium]|nr:hypothetical protein [Flavobacteriales bacterium]
MALVMLAIALFGVCGCILPLFLTGTPLNVGSYTGIIMIVGIIGENAIFTYPSMRTTARSKAWTIPSPVPSARACG